MGTGLCTCVYSVSSVEMAKICMGRGSGGGFSEQLCPALAVLVTVRSVCPYCSSERNQTALKRRE